MAKVLLCFLALLAFVNADCSVEVVKNAQYQMAHCLVHMDLDSGVSCLEMKEKFDVCFETEISTVSFYLDT